MQCAINSIDLPDWLLTIGKDGGYFKRRSRIFLFQTSSSLVPLLCRCDVQQNADFIWELFTSKYPGKALMSGPSPNIQTFLEHFIVPGKSHRRTRGGTALWRANQIVPIDQPQFSRRDLSMPLVLFCFPSDIGMWLWYFETKWETKKHRPRHSCKPSLEISASARRHTRGLLHDQSWIVTKPDLKSPFTFDEEMHFFHFTLRFGSSKFLSPTTSRSWSEWRCEISVVHSLTYFSDSYSPFYRYNHLLKLGQWPITRFLRPSMHTPRDIILVQRTIEVQL